MWGRFAGWPEGAFDVLMRSQGGPSQSLREECRKHREQLVRQPMIALLNEVAERVTTAGRPDAVGV